MGDDLAAFDARHQVGGLLVRQREGAGIAAAQAEFRRALGPVIALGRRERLRDLFRRRQLTADSLRFVPVRGVPGRVILQQQLKEDLEVVDLFRPLLFVHLQHIAVHDLDHRAEEGALVQSTQQHHAVVVVGLVLIPDLGHGGVLVDPAAVAAQAGVAALPTGEGALREGLGGVAHHQLHVIVRVHTVEVHGLGQDRRQVNEVHLQHGIGGLGDIIVVADVEVAVVDLHGADGSREAVGIDVEGIHGRGRVGMVDAVVPLVVRRVAHDGRPGPGAAVRGGGAVFQRAFQDGIAREALGLLQRVGIDGGVNALGGVQGGVQRLLTGVDGHVQLSVVLDHLIDRAAVVGVIHMVGGVVEELLALLGDLLELGVAQGAAVHLDALEAAVGVEVIGIGGVGDDVRAVHPGDGGDQRALVDRDGAGDGEDIGSLHGAVLLHRHGLIDGAEGVILRVDLEDGGNAGGGVCHVLRAYLGADKVEPAVVRHRVAQRDLVAVDGACHQDLGLAGLDVDLEEDALGGNGVLGVVVVTVEQGDGVVHQLLVVLHSLLVGAAVLVLLVLQKTHGLEHRSGIVLGDAGAAVHGADVDPVAVAQGGERVGLAGVAGEALLDLAQHPGDLIL